MQLHLQKLALLATTLVVSFSQPAAAEVTDIPTDASIQWLIASAKAARAQGRNGDALKYFDAAVKRDTSDYLNIFQRGATYLSLGRNAQAKADFDGVLRIRPGFEGALLQRAKINARNADWPAAKDDYRQVGSKAARELADLEEAEGAAYLAADAENQSDWEGCVNQAGVAIVTAGTSLSLRQLRARCRLEKGDIEEGISDLAHVLQIHPGIVDPHLQISAMQFYSLGDTERGLAQVKKCLHSDPDSKPCKSLFREEKSMLKVIDKVQALLDKKQFSSAAKLLVGTGSEDDIGLLAELRTVMAAHRESGVIHRQAGSGLYGRYVERTCECYHSMNNQKKAASYCEQTLDHNPASLHALLHQAQVQVDAEKYDAAIATLNTAKDHHPESREIQQKLQEAHALLKRSKSKDYYKVLGVSRDADERTIKRAYRQTTKEFHPDKAMARGVTKEDAERKMATINEAYEVLSDPELKARFDAGDDPNDPMSQQGGHPFQGSPFGGPGGQQFFFQPGGQRVKFSSGGMPFGGGGGRGQGGGGGNPFGGFPFGM